MYMKLILYFYILISTHLLNQYFDYTSLLGLDCPRLEKLMKVLLKFLGSKLKSAKTYVLEFTNLFPVIDFKLL